MRINILLGKFGLEFVGVVMELFLILS